MATSWKVTVKNRPLQLVAVKDVGWFAAQAFLHPERFSGRQVPLAGDELTLEEANAIFKTKVGTEMPEMFHFLVKLLHWFIAEFGAMYKWFNTDGFGVSIPAVMREHPGLLTFGEWIETETQVAGK